MRTAFLALIGFQDIKLSSRLYGGKNINSNLSLNSSKKGNLHAAIERAKEKFEYKEIE